MSLQKHSLLYLQIKEAVIYDFFNAQYLAFRFLNTLMETTLYIPEECLLRIKSHVF